MSLSIGIVGLPNVGKSTLFNALTRNSVPASNYPFCTIDPSVGIVPVPDERLDKLAAMSQSIKKIPAVVEFTDIAGLVKGASEGEGLGNKFLANIREVDAIAHVVRIFNDQDIIHVHGEVKPLSDVEIINLELILADQNTVQKRLSNLEKEVKRQNKEAIAEKQVLEKVDTTLADGKMANTINFEKEELEIVKHLHLLSMKPMLYVLNKKGDKSDLDSEDASLADKENFQKLLNYFSETSAKYVFVNAQLENDILDMSEEEKQMFRDDGNTQKSGIEDLIKAGYEALNLMTYFTTGEKETRAWTTRKDSVAPEAAAAIHTDFQNKFIRATVIETEKLLEAGSHSVAREKGWLRTEGKEYIVQDGDVMEFLI